MNGGACDNCCLCKLITTWKYGPFLLLVYYVLMLFLCPVVSSKWFTFCRARWDAWRTRRLQQLRPADRRTVGGAARTYDGRDLNALRSFPLHLLLPNMAIDCLRLFVSMCRSRSGHAESCAYRFARLTPCSPPAWFWRLAAAYYFCFILDAVGIALTLTRLFHHWL